MFKSQICCSTLMANIHANLMGICDAWLYLWVFKGSSVCTYCAHHAVILAPILGTSVGDHAWGVVCVIKVIF